MGNFFHATTVRNFWGREWHQMIRRVISTPGTLLRNALGVKRGTMLSSYMQLYVGFAFSVVMHAAGALNVSRETLGEPWWFMSQAVMITIEDFVMYLGHSVGIQEAGTFLLPLLPFSQVLGVFQNQRHVTLC